MKRNEWQSPNSGPPSESPEIILYVSVFIAVLAVAWAFAMAGCVSKPSAPEPEWEPKIYSLHYDGKTCEVFDAGDDFGDHFQCSSQRLLEFYCAPLSDLVELKKKLQRCEVWR